MQLVHEVVPPEAGPHAMLDNLVQLAAEDTLQYDRYEDKSQKC